MIRVQIKVLRIFPVLNGYAEQLQVTIDTWTHLVAEVIVD
jgi:hypothetical protein